MFFCKVWISRLDCHLHPKDFHFWDPFFNGFLLAFVSGIELFDNCEMKPVLWKKRGPWTPAGMRFYQESVLSFPQSETRLKLDCRRLCSHCSWALVSCYSAAQAVLLNSHQTQDATRVKRKTISGAVLAWISSWSAKVKQLWSIPIPHYFCTTWLLAHSYFSQQSLVNLNCPLVLARIFRLPNQPDSVGGTRLLLLSGSYYLVEKSTARCLGAWPESTKNK